MGWVRKHLAESNEEVHGLIIARVGDEALSYAVSAVPNLKFMTYWNRESNRGPGRAKRRRAARAE